MTSWQHSENMLAAAVCFCRIAKCLFMAYTLFYICKIKCLSVAENHLKILWYKTLAFYLPQM